METWDQYNKAVDALREPAGAFMKAFAEVVEANAVVEDTNSDDWGFSCAFSLNGVEHYASLQLWDAGESSGDVEPGEKGNLHFSVDKGDGEIVGSWIPHNYSDHCWVPYTDIAELVRRVPTAEEGRILGYVLLRNSTL